MEISFWFSNLCWWPRRIRASEGDKDRRDRGQVASDERANGVDEGPVVRGSVDSRIQAMLLATKIHNPPGAALGLLEGWGSGSGSGNRPARAETARGARAICDSEYSCYMQVCVASSAVEVLAQVSGVAAWKLVECLAEGRLRGCQAAAGCSVERCCSARTKRTEC